MGIKEIFSILSKGESETVEFKERADRVGKDIVAFLNSQGGHLLIGVSDDGNIIGAKRPRDLERVISEITPYPGEFIKKEEVEIGGKKVILLSIRKSPFLHSLRGTAYVRIGTSSVPLRMEEVAERLAETGSVHFDEMVCRTCSLKDISPRTVKAYVKERKAWRRIGERTTVRDVLAEIGGLKKDGLTNGAILFFGKQPQRFFPQACIRITVGSITEPTKQYLLDGNLWEQFLRAYDIVYSLLPRIPIFKGKTREDVPAVQPLVLRELLANAIIHRNYVDTSFIEIILLPDKMIIRNPGGFVPPATPEHPIHKTRNPFLSRWFFDVGIVEKYGSGIQKIKEISHKTGYPLPEFKEWRGYTEVIVPFLRGWKGMSDKDVRVLSLLSEGPKTSGEIARAMGVSQDTVLRILRRLIEKGLVITEGAGRATRYLLR